MTGPQEAALAEAVRKAKAAANPRDRWDRIAHRHAQRAALREERQ
jgi:hypothetical protein